MKLAKAVIPMALIIFLTSCTVPDGISSKIKYNATKSQADDISGSSKGNITYYFPRDGQKPQTALVDLINSATQTLDMAIYSFTDSKISDALINAHDRGVDVRVITDSSESNNKYQKTVLESLSKDGIPIKSNAHSGLMHLKVTIADNKNVTTGSFNYTASAENKNDEVFVVIKDANSAIAFDKEFQRMWEDAKGFKNY